MIADIAREAAIVPALVAGAVVDIRKREVCRPALFLMLAAGALTPDLGFIVQSAVVLAGFCVLILIKKTDIGIGGGDIWVIACLTFAVGAARVLLSLAIGLLILVVSNKARTGKTEMRKEAALVPFIAAGHMATLSVLLAAARAVRIAGVG